MIAAACTEENQQFTCASTEEDKDALTTSEQISTVYKACPDYIFILTLLQAIFAFYTFVIALLFLHSGLKVIKLLATTDQFRDALIKSSIATLIATLSLYVTVGISLYTVNNTLESMPYNPACY